MTIQVAVIGARPTASSNGGKAFNLGGGDGNLVELLGIHYSLETIAVTEAAVLFQLALSSDPEHENVGAGAFDVFMQHKALYGRGTFFFNHDGAGDAVADRWNKTIPLYGLVRPRRQVLVWSIINGTLASGFSAELYYEPFEERNRTMREAVNREYGKYRRL